MNNYTLKKTIKLFILLFLSAILLACSRSKSKPDSSDEDEQQFVPVTYIKQPRIVFKGNIINQPSAVVPNQYIIEAAVEDEDELKKLLKPLSPESIQKLKVENNYLVVFEKDPGYGLLSEKALSEEKIIKISPQVQYSTNQ